MFRKIRGFPVMALNSPPMLALPGLFVINTDFIQILSKFMQDGHGQDRSTLWSLDFIAVLPAVFIELDVVQYDKNIGLGDFMDVAQPGKVVQLMDGDEHKLVVGRQSSVVSKKAVLPDVPADLFYKFFTHG